MPPSLLGIVYVVLIGKRNGDEVYEKLKRKG
jgi:hypothetical protein